MFGNIFELGNFGNSATYPGLLNKWPLHFLKMPVVTLAVLIAGSLLWK